MRYVQIIIIAVVIMTAGLAGAVMMGTADAGKTATYFACADATTGVLRRVPAEERCADGEERLVWSDGQQEPTPPPSIIKCLIEVNETIFPNLTDVPFAEIAATKPCTLNWDGPTRITIKMTIEIIRIHDPRPDWITNEFNPITIHLINMPDCSYCHQQFNESISQPTYSKCDPTMLTCSVDLNFNGVTTLTASTPIQLWLGARLEITKSKDELLVYDESIFGATLKVTGSLQAQQIKP